MHHPTTKKRGADPDVPTKRRRRSTAAREHQLDPREHQLEQGLEETMAGSDPVSVTQPRKDGDKDSE
jgi:hypothetical protein